MVTIEGHTFDESKTSNGWVIDAGCRGWAFSNYFWIDSIPVFAMDIEDFTHQSVYEPKLIFKHAALMATAAEVEAHYFGNGTGNFVKGINGVPSNTEDRPCDTKPVKAITLKDIYAEIGTNIDLLKLDIEGAEYEVMLNMEPIPKQVTVEFHEHCNPDLHKRHIEDVLTHMSKNYVFNLYVREWPRYRFMDCLFIRKDLV